METDLNQIKKIILGEEYDELLSLRDEINDDVQFSKIVSNVITEALKERAHRDDSVAQVLAPTIDQAISSSINQDPKKMAESLYPIMGPAIRKSITETMQQMLENLNQLMEDSLSPRSLGWRFNAWRTGRPYSELVMLNTLEFSVEQVFLIHRETSLLINHQYSELADTRDPDMVSGMFSAIQDFIEDSFSTQEGDELDTLRLGHLSVVIQRGPNAILAAVVRGRIPEDLRNDMSQVLENLHRIKKSELTDYSGDPDIFIDIEEDLQKILISERKEPEPKGVPWLAVLGISAVLAAVGFWQYLQHQDAKLRSELLEILAQEPGLVILNAEFSDDIFNITLLADQEARNPGEVIPTEQENFSISFTKHSHLSALDEIVSRRARKLLQPAAETQIDVIDSVLVLSGRANGDWMQAFNLRWPAVTGLLDVDSTDLQLYYPRREAIAATIELIESASLSFENGETETEIDPTFLNGLAEQIQQLNSLAIKEYGYPVKIDVIGYTDESGSTQVNRRIGLERAQSFRQALIDTGVNEDLLGAENAIDHPSYNGLAERLTRLVVDANLPR